MHNNRSYYYNHIKLIEFNQTYLTIKTNKMKKIIYATVGALALFATSCKKENLDQGQKELVVSGVVDTLKGDITVNTTVTKTTYLKGLVYVKPGVTLTVNAGVSIKGSLGDIQIDGVNLENNKGTLIVEKGAKLVANGTATSPIIWTSEKNVGTRNFGDWGGIVILGNAPIYTTTGAQTNGFEPFDSPIGFNDPVPNTSGRNNYGGSSPADNSGSMTYNRIDFAGGIVTAPNKETNGLTLCGVGNGTTLNHIEVSNSGDDGFEFFGGTVNASYLLSFGNKDDDYDFDQAYAGNLQFIIAFRNDLADVSGSEMIELDNNTNTTVAGAVWGGVKTLPFITNATLIGPASSVVRGGVVGRFDGAVYVRRAGLIRLANSLIIAQAMPCAFAVTSSTIAPLLLVPTSLGASAVVNNLFQVNDTLRVVQDANNSNPIVILPMTNLASLTAQFATYSNTFLANYGAFKLGVALNPLTDSPALTGGTNLASLGFIPTTERGALRSTDIWTAQPWISTAVN